MSAKPTAVAGGEVIEPTFFESQGERLYGCLHRPAGGRNLGSVVLCPPMGHEYTASHRALRQLAAQLARAGHFALRFDYSGTGDSSSDDEKRHLAHWRADIDSAIAFCKRATRAAAITLIGARVGGSLALQAAAGRTDLRALALWSPVLAGRALVEQWRAAQDEFALRLGYPPNTLREEVLGFPLENWRAEELAALDGAAADLRLPRALLLHLPSEDPEAAALEQRLQQMDVAVTRVSYDQGAVWRQEALEAIVPAAVLRTLVDWVGAGT